MGFDLGLLKKNLEAFAKKCGVAVEEIGNLADQSVSVDDFKAKLDDLCRQIGTTSAQVLAEIGMRLANTNISPDPKPTGNSPLQNEIVEVKGKIDKLNERDKTQKA